MPSENFVLLMGHLGQDAETRFTPSGVAVTNFSIATTRRWADEKAEGGFAEATDWHRVQAWRQSDYIQESLKKGNLIMVKGRLQTRQYTDKEGTERWITEVICGPGGVMFLREPNRRGPRDEDAPADLVSAPRSHRNGGTSATPAGVVEMAPEDDYVPF